VIVGGVPHHVVPDLSGPTGAAAASHQTLPLVRPDRATGGVRADRVGAKLSSRAGAHQKAAVPAERASRTHASPDGRSRAVKAGRPLARETSAGGARRVVRSLGSAWRVSGSQGSDANVGQPSPGSGGRHGGWPQNHPEGFLPVQRKLGAPRRRTWSGGSVDPLGCARGLFWLQKSARVTWSRQPPRRVTAVGSAGSSLQPRASCTFWARRGDRSRLAAAKPGARWRAVDDPAPRGGCASSGSEEGASPGGASRSAGERALVEGRRPGVGEAVVFDETAAEAAPGGVTGAFRPKGRIGSRGIATEGVRGHVAGSARG